MMETKDGICYDLTEKGKGHSKLKSMFIIELRLVTQVFTWTQIGSTKLSKFNIEKKVHYEFFNHVNQSGKNIKKTKNFYYTQ